MAFSRDERSHDSRDGENRAISPQEKGRLSGLPAKGSRGRHVTRARLLNPAAKSTQNLRLFSVSLRASQPFAPQRKKARGSGDSSRRWRSSDFTSALTCLDRSFLRI